MIIDASFSLKNAKNVKSIPVIVHMFCDECTSFQRATDTMFATFIRHLISCSIATNVDKRVSLSQLRKTC